MLIFLIQNQPYLDTSVRASAFLPNKKEKSLLLIKAHSHPASN